jgi:broad specificity phosphatase PhoE
MLYLVRHGRPLVDRSKPAHEWELDPAAYDDVWALRESGRLPERAAWFCSPEPKAVATAQLLTEGDVGVLDGLREQLRDGSEWVEDFEDAVRRAFAVPEAVAVPGWEPLADCRARVVRAVEAVLAAHGDSDVVLVGHGTAWTVLAAALTGTEPDLDRWRALQMPDLIVIDPLRSKG